ncbi:benzoate 4-monooxygenase [Fusarium tjaetaba]|uniref:Benzoate 4-monooxygenase n=1 Tax=Fusarium tjaetaba TaxID=1567544 RepID=A0A8H5RPX9_9HYPO|nr:benzoate 4-monooxygenase [Fusarium tjaetaba]KAF5637333.1 benzoate 4-monooxygenase [Fusarium tjaetaba]
MCRETITIAQCAPKESPVLAFYCAKLHLVAKDRIVCEAAKGKCICFFGSCGSIEREIPTKGIDLGEVVKARCAECTPREHRVRDIPAQEILESALLRSTDGQNGWEERSKILSELWLNKTACPYHDDTSSEPTAPISEVISITDGVHLDAEVSHSGAGLSAEPVEPANSTPESSIELKPGFEAAVGKHFGESSSPENTAMKDATSSPAGTVFTEPIYTDSFVAEPASTLADEWTTNADTAGAADQDEWTTNTAPVREQGDNADDHVSESGAKDILDPDEVGISTSRWAPGNSPVNSKPAVDSKDPESELEQAQPPVVAPSRRAVNFSYNPNNAEKLNEAVEIFASLKKGFLCGKA